MPNKFATECRYCHRGGDLYKGAHRACKADAVRQFVRDSRGVDPKRYKHPSDRPTACASCPAPPFGGSLWCEACLKNRKRASTRQWQATFRANQRKREVRAEKNAALPPRPCACGCGGMVMNPKAKFATRGCWPKSRPKKTKPTAAQQQAKSSRMKPMFVGTQVREPQPAPVVIDGDVQVRRLPSLMPVGLRDMFGTHGPARLATDDLEGR